MRFTSSEDDEWDIVKILPYCETFALSGVALSSITHGFLSGPLA